MPQFEAGYAEGLNDIARRKYLQDQIQEAQRRTALEELINQQNQQAKQRALAAPGQASAFLPGSPTGPPLAPPTGQPPGPGMSSPPMAPPQGPAPPMGPTAIGAPGGALPMGAPPMGGPPGGAAPQPVGWNPSASAKPELGGGAPPKQTTPGDMPTEKVWDYNDIMGKVPPAQHGTLGPEILQRVEAHNKYVKAQWDEYFSKQQALNQTAQQWDLERKRKEFEKYGIELTPDIRNALFATGGNVPSAATLVGAVEERKTIPSGGGPGKLTDKEFLYPRNKDGTPDTTKDPVGTRGLDRNNKMVYLDPDGEVTTAAALAGATPKEGKAAKIGVTNVVRQNIVKAGVTNSLARLDEIEKKFPDTNTSAFFGQAGENPFTRGIYGAGRGTMSSGQKQADAAWASFIDEAIPVFTGGLRGSDAFRRFLIEQAPGPGDDKKSRAEKIRLIKANIKGTSKAFFSRFASDPAMWGPGTKPEDVEAAGEVVPAKEGEWKVEKVN